MKRSLADRLAPILFVVAVAVLSVFYGILASRFGWFPAPQIWQTEATLRDLSTFWRNDLGLEPNRHLVDATSGRDPKADPFTLRKPGAAAPGYVLVSGLSPDQDVSFHAVTLYDGEGRQVHRWPVHYDQIDPDGTAPENVMIHGMEVFEDGSIVLAFDNGQAISRIDACGVPIWTTDGGYHHSITRDGQGRLWAWNGDNIESLDEANGETLTSLDLREQIISADGSEGIYAINALTQDSEGFVWKEDPFHTNDVEPLEPDMAAAFPMFQAGDLLVSLREINLVAVIDPTEGRLRWYSHGPWHRQHDPDFQPDGTITVFDNGTALGVSRILRVDPADDSVTEVFRAGPDARFYTWRRGKHQVLPNGNILLTEAERGRVLEVNPEGEIVWEREFPWDAERNLIVTEARHVPPGFFADGLPACTGKAD